MARTLRFSLVTVAMAIAVGLLCGGPALAAGSHPAGGIGTHGFVLTQAAVPSPTPSENASQSPVPASGRDLRWLSGVVLGFALVALMLVFWYLSVAEGRYYQIMEKSLTTLGEVPNSAPSSPFVGLSEVAMDTSKALDVTGPTTLIVGQALEYKASADGAAVQATWTTDPADGSVTLNPSSGSTDRVQVTANKAVAFTLRASAGASSGETHISAVTLPSSPGTIQFIGSGWGTVVIAIVVVAVITILAMLSALDSQAVSALLGALLGYIFLKAGTELGQGGSGGSGSGSGGSSTGGTSQSS